MATTRTDIPPHPSYGLPDEVRRTILRDAEILGVKAAAAANGVHPTSIHNWRKRLSLALNTNKSEASK